MKLPKDIRKIIHIDMDAFFASVEQRDFPEYRGKPIAVGGSSYRGVVAAASYEARKFGVRSAMPSVRAKKLCPQLIFVKGRMEVYREVSQQIRDIFLEYTDLVEPLSLDEAYLDVTENRLGISSAMKIGKEIRRKIVEKTGLTASAGISYNKFLAKTASGMNKPNGFTVILPEQAESFLEQLAIDRFYGIGKVTARKMHDLGIHTGKELKQWSLPQLMQQFGKVGRFYYHIVRGIDERQVNPERIRKSISVEQTYSEDLKTKAELEDAIDSLVERLMPRLEKNEAYGHTITLKIKYEDFTLNTRSLTVPGVFQNDSQITKYAKSLLCYVDLEQHSVRLLGVGLSSLENTAWHETGRQLTFDFS
ncbi:MAG: DNA polymerase IV [Cyclobacteriaceae bacterium]